MSNVIKKSRVLISESKLLGSILYFNDKQNRPCFKFSIKNKASPLKLWSIKDGKRINIIDDSLPNGKSIDISYKFSDNLLEVKRQETGTNIKRKFYKIPFPVENYLFILTINGWNLLKNVEKNNEDFEIKVPENSTKISIVFSFLGADGKGFADPEHRGNFYMSKAVNLPNKDFNKILIGVLEEKSEIDDNKYFDFKIKIPIKNDINPDWEINY